jgi:hypothetical protein
MGSFIQAICGGGDNSSKKALQEQQKQRELTQISQARASQQAKDNSADTAAQTAAAKVARGQRLLISKEEGGLASTLGSA